MLDLVKNLVNNRAIKSNGLEQAVVATIWVGKSTLSAYLNDIEQSLAFYNPKRIKPPLHKHILFDKFHMSKIFC
jgi:hypothetical protein